MGVYLTTPHKRGRVEYLIEEHGASEIEPVPPSDMPEGQRLICVLFWPTHEAAGFVYDDREFEAFAETVRGGGRARWLVMDDAAMQALIVGRDRRELEGVLDAGG